MLRRLKVPRTIARGHGRVRACRAGEEVDIRFGEAARRRLLRSRHAPFLLRLHVEARNAGGVARGTQEIELDGNGEVTP